MTQVSLFMDDDVETKSSSRSVLSPSEQAMLSTLHCRPYQYEAVESAFAEWKTHRSTLIVLPTGMGKTHTGGAICRLWDWFRKGRILWLAHRKELIEQAAERLEMLIGYPPEIEMADQKANSGRGLIGASSVVVASIQSLMAGRKCQFCGGCGTDDDTGDVCGYCIQGRVRRLQKFDPSSFGLIVTDEAHHGIADQYQQVYNWFSRNPLQKFLGLTATPDRGDDAALGQIFNSVAKNIELSWAIEEGWLVPIQQQSIQCSHLDFSKVRTTAGDLNGRDLEEILMAEENLHEMVLPTMEICDDRKTLIFCADRTHTQMVCELLRRYKPHSAEFILGDTDKEQRALHIANHKAGNFQYLVNCGVATEGYDDPTLQVVAVMRPTKSRALYAQMIGRGTRPINPPKEETAEERRAGIAASSKPELLILDFVGNAGKHKLINAVDILGGKYDTQVQERARKIVEKSDKAEDVEEVLKRAEGEIADEKEAERQKQIREAKRREWLKAERAKYTVEKVDPFRWYDTLPNQISAEKMKRPATEGQVNALKKFGLADKDAANKSFAEASAILNHLRKRKDKGLCSYKQSKLLQKHGCDPNMSFHNAKKVIDLLAANRWQMNDHIRKIAQMYGSN